MGISLRRRAAALLAIVLLLATPATTAPSPIPIPVEPPVLTEGGWSAEPPPADPGDSFPLGEAPSPVDIPASICSLPWPCHEALQVAACESGLDPAAVGQHGERGIFQVMADFWGAVPADPAGQAWQAFLIWQEHGWEPWSCRP